MKILYLLSVAALLGFGGPVLAEQTDSGKPMMHDMKACDMHKMKQEKMKGMMEMKKKHMQAVETRLANIENLLKELVAMHKKKHDEH